MLAFASLSAFAALLVSSVAGQSSTSTSAAPAKTVVITVGGNTTANSSLVFQPEQVYANVGDTVYFNFTQGNHTAIQSLFATPCLPANYANNTINGFYSGFRPTNNGTAFSGLTVEITPDLQNTTLWFYDWTLCGKGGVGAINPNNSYGSYQNFDAFLRNAERLNGSTAATHSYTTPTQTGSSQPTSSSSGNTSSSGASSQIQIFWSMAATLPLLAAGAMLL